MNKFLSQTRARISFIKMDEFVSGANCILPACRPAAKDVGRDRHEDPDPHGLAEQEKFPAL